MTLECYSLSIHKIIWKYYSFFYFFSLLDTQGCVLNIQVIIFIIFCFFMKSFFVFLLILFVSVNCIDQKFDISHFNVSRIFNKKSVATTYSTSTNAPSILFSLILHIIECGSYYTCVYDSDGCIDYIMSFI